MTEFQKEIDKNQQLQERIYFLENSLPSLLEKEKELLEKEYVVEFEQKVKSLKSEIR